MNNKIDYYFCLLSRFYSGKISIIDFQKIYLRKFKSETTRFDESIYKLLDALFGDVDAYTADQELIKANPDYYLDENELRARVECVLDALRLQQSEIRSESN